MDTQKTLFFVGAHPDDETFGVGGTLVQYASAGVRVYYICATRGEAGKTDPAQAHGHDTLGDTRWEELKCAAKVLKLTDFIYLGYRDSGMLGSEDNKHPDALVGAPLEQVTGRIVKAMRELKPQVVITFDPIGGYRHPDHIAIHKATVEAFHAARDPKQYPKAGLAFKPQKLYSTVFSRRYLKIAVKLLPFFGRDPHRIGRNKDIDITSLAEVDFQVHATISLSTRSIEKRNEASACYTSQSDGGPSRLGFLSLIRKIFGRRDLYMRVDPAVHNRIHENDLFDGIV